MLEKTLRVNYLYDFYGPLLTERQQDILNMYYVDDLSLSEIAQEIQISRQGVYDLLRRTVRQLEKIESKLQHYQKFLARQATYGEIVQMIEDAHLETESKEKIIRFLTELHYQD